jgi:glycosyltransferase involved in cell wall biosynthesis
VNVQWVDDRVVACVRAGLRPLVISCWGSDINYHFQPEYAKSWHRRGLGRAIASADYVTADTQEILERCEIMARRALRTQLFYFGIDPARFRAGFAAEASTLRQGLGISREARVIFNPRRLQPPMGHRHTLRAFAELTNTVGVPESVIVFKSYARACSETEEEIRKEVGKLGLANRVFWLGETSYSEVPVHYAMADLVVNYPELDGFPVSFFEAALCRRPVVTSDLLAYRGVFDHAFVSVRPADATALANALHHCLTEPPEETRRRVDKAYSIALDIGDQRKCIRVLTSVFSEASKAHSRREGTATDSSGYNRGRSRQ